jgi:hypothetical protein
MENGRLLENPCSSRVDLEGRPIPAILLPNHLCQHRLKRRDAKQRDDTETLKVVIHPPNATASIHENQIRAFQCRQAIRKLHERYRSKWGGEDPRR